nr:alpha/beta family hydrolase [uncultured Rhodopila sp.]
MATDTAVMIELEPARSVSGLLKAPPNATAGFVMAHGAGAGMTHPFMAAVADGLAARRIATLRYQFPYMETGSKRPDRPAPAHATVRAAVAAAHELLPSLPLFAGGKSFGARMTSQAQAEAPLPGVRGLIFLGFPLHPARQPSDGRAAHLAEVTIPMLFLQGTRDALADRGLLVPLTDRLGAALHVFDHADHSFHVPVRSGRTDAQVLQALCDTITAWIGAVLGPAGSPPRTGRP